MHEIIHPAGNRDDRERARCEKPRDVTLSKGGILAMQLLFVTIDDEQRHTGHPRDQESRLFHLLIVKNYEVFQRRLW